MSGGVFSLDRPTIGTWLTLADPAVAEIMAAAGFEWLSELSGCRLLYVPLRPGQSQRRPLCYFTDIFNCLGAESLLTFRR